MKSDMLQLVVTLPIENPGEVDDATSHSPQPLGWGISAASNREPFQWFCAIETVSESTTRKPLKWFWGRE